MGVSIVNDSIKAYTDVQKLVEFEHLMFKERVCRVCGKEKSLLDDFYMTHGDRGSSLTAFSYECKVCTIKRTAKRGKVKQEVELYPDW